jgi:hypothetical protein
MIDRPGLRGAQVVHLGGDARDPPELVGAPQASAGFFPERGVVHGVTTLCSLRCAGLLEALVGVLADSFEQPVAGVALVIVGEHERTPDERAEVLEDVELVDGVAPDDRFGVIE